jgi:uncharacterized membrane protein
VSNPESRSKLLPLGFSMMIIGVVFPRALSFFAEGLEPGRLQRIVTAASGVLLACFLVGLVLGIIGFIKNRRALKS